VRSTLTLEVEGSSLARTGADLAVAGFFRDQRPLAGGAGLADWRLCGWLSGLLEETRMRGDVGEGVLLLTHGRLRAPRLLLIGLGPRARYGSDAHRLAVRDALVRALDLGAASLALDLPAPTADPSAERVARDLLEGAFEALESRSARVVLRVAAPGAAARLRTALEQSATALPKGSTSLKLVRPPPPAARPAEPSAARPGEPRPPAPVRSRS
jgi:hypothetical protein